MNAGEVAATVLLILGCALQLIAVLGLTVMRDAYDRLHYVGMVSYGAFLVALAVLVRAGFSLLGEKALATGVLLVLSGPLIVHVTARALRMREHGDWRAGIERHREER